MDQPLLFLIKLAWACRYRLPILITVAFMALDIRMQIEIHVQMRRIRRGPAIANNDSIDSENSSGSWLTADEDDEDDDDEYFDNEREIASYITDS